MNTRLSLIVVAAIAIGACSLNPPRSTLPTPPTPDQMAELWQEPADIATRDLYGGPGGRRNAPDPAAAFKIVELDKTGFSAGYDVEDAQGREWSVKIGQEARPETVVSRIIWAVGYHQPPTYYLPTWRAANDTVPKAAARFRLDKPGPKKADDWFWNTNPFVGTRPFQGLFVLMVMLNNWDLKNTQNVLYDVEGSKPSRWFVVRDLGASLGNTRWFIPGSRDNLVDFEREPFITEVNNGRVEFHYRGAWREPYLKHGMRVDDVVWICGWLSRLSDAQWRDAFRAGGYSPDESRRYITKLKQKIADGLRLRTEGA
jgi:hypothetical protein